MKDLLVALVAGVLLVGGCASNKDELQRQFSDLRAQIIQAEECRQHPLLLPPPPLRPPPPIFAYMEKGGLTTQPARR